MMEFYGPHGEVVRGRSDLVARYAQICRDQETEKQEWIRDLRNRGIKGAHPDDGWVDREKNLITLCYPQFNDDVSIGDLFALGWPDKYRIVRLIKERPMLFSINGQPERFAFEEADPTG